jgi:hypothetical protein
LQAINEKTNNKQGAMAGKRWMATPHDETLDNQHGG